MPVAAQEIEEVTDTTFIAVTPDTMVTAAQTTPSMPTIHAPALVVDTTQSAYFWHITERTGEIFPAHPDTFLTDYFNRTNMEGLGLAVQYLGNLGSPAQSRVFFERPDRSQFLFSDVYSYFLRTPENFNFLNSKIPYSVISYQRAGSRQQLEERLKGVMAVNFGKKLNIGVDVDYLYARGFYKSQSAKHLDWMFFGTYLSDRHQLHVMVNPMDYNTAENGGITNDDFISHPENVDATNMTSRDIPANFAVTDKNTTWNHTKGNQLYLNYHYNLGIERDAGQTEEGDTLKQFIPVSSIIFTSHYKNSKRNFFTEDSTAVAKYYFNQTDFFKQQQGVSDSTSYLEWNNTVALSMREGFSDWAKFDLTAFLTWNYREFTIMDTVNVANQQNYPQQNALYLGGELAKRTGKILRYNAQGSFGVWGENLLDMDLRGQIETRIPLWGDTASIKGKGYWKNLEPTFYEQHYHSRYFWWDKDFDKVKKVFVGGTVTVPHTKTQVSLGVENLTNYIYFDSLGMPQQQTENIQILALQLNQNFKYKGLHWDNQVVYQTSSNKDILPLPEIAAYSSLYVDFKIANVLTIQMGVNAHYWTSYYAPAYEPATQQFRLQKAAENGNKVKVGNYPLISGFLNCHLKQTRFFIEYYNAGSAWIAPPEYFSTPHYPVNPTILKMGLAVDFIN
ncbi:hypothetical protein FACS1894176_08350 [Bacteroidia bacterium]|nr:hypothetical protein FACS1894176_08350 [Bacteroidia bacterium]